MHHDIMLGAFPLCIEWLDFDPGSDEPGCLIAVGTMSTQVRNTRIDLQKIIF